MPIKTVKTEGKHMEMPIPMRGWNTWNTFGANINDNMIRESADTIVKSGLKDAGYEYIVIDDCWSCLLYTSDAADE